MAKNRRDHSFKITVTRAPPATESSEGSSQVNRKLAKLDITIEKGIAMLSKEVQDLVDKSEQQTKFIKAVDAGMDAMRAQNDELKAKIEEIASQPPKEMPADTNGPAVPAGGDQPAPTVVYSLSDEDKQALLGVAKKYDEAIDALRDNIPANVPESDMSQPAKQPEPAADAPPIPDAASHATDANAASQAQPLPGTGAPTEETPKEPGAA